VSIDSKISLWDDGGEEWWALGDWRTGLAEMKIKLSFLIFFITFLLLNGCKVMQATHNNADFPSSAVEELITTAHYPNGKPIPYILNFSNPSPRVIVILFPGGSGVVNPHMEDRMLIYNFKDNFLLRSRKYIVDDDFATLATDSTDSKERIQAILDDINRRFPKAQVYLMGTSRGTSATMHLAGYLSDRIAGEIHTSSMSEISFFDARKYKNRHLIVHHRYDGCSTTPFSSAEYSHKKYGNDLIVMEGGVSSGNWCQAFAYHGYNGIEKETIRAIKKWIKQGD
jgi:hypothetical protein